LVAAAALELDGVEAVCLCSLGTDGVDGPTPAAGALAAGSSVSRASEIGLSVEAVLRDNDTFHLFDRLDDLVVTGPTGTNVMDVQILLLGER
jgi:hydroxypyruvate reductase